ncbi:hypothetical protein C8R43DRAFT_1230456 [Mycena crocata]|nr:hypothetical protein C8R43DRAFT_1230456 [Mycena crocata]
MRATSIVLLSTAACAFATPGVHRFSTSHLKSRQTIQCPSEDADGRALTGFGGAGNLITCIYAGSHCMYYAADGSFSVRCPPGVVLGPSATTVSSSTVSPSPTGTDSTGSFLPGVPAPSSASNSESPASNSSLPPISASNSESTAPSLPPSFAPNQDSRVTPSSGPSLPGVPAPSSASASSLPSFIPGAPAPNPTTSGFLTGVPAPSTSPAAGQTGGAIALGGQGIGGVLVAVGLVFPML